MQDNNGADKQDQPQSQGFFATLLQGLIRDTIGLLIAFLIGTAAGAALCLYFGVPLAAAFVGGIVVLALYVARDSF